MDNVMYLEMKKIVEEKHRVDIDTPYCENWRACNDSCLGCESEVGCHKLNDIIKVLEIGGLMSFLGVLKDGLESPKPNINLISKIANTAADVVREIIEDKDGKYQPHLTDEEKKLSALLKNYKNN
jgi:hypothetical protein